MKKIDAIWKALGKVFGIFTMIFYGIGFMATLGCAAAYVLDVEHYIENKPGKTTANHVADIMKQSYTQ